MSTVEAVQEAVGLSSSTHQDAPIRRGEHKSSNHKQLEPTRQLATDTEINLDGVRQDAVRMLASPGLIGEVVADVQQLGVIGEDLLILMVYLTATARLMRRAIHLCVTGSYSTGKTFLVRTVLRLMPETDVFMTTQLTPKHLMNLDEKDKGKYRHKVIFIAEQVSDEAGLAFREMAESGEVRNLTVVDNKAEECVAEGPVTFISTTTRLPKDFKDEDASRLFFLSTDDSEEQTEQVIKARSTRAKSPPSEAEHVCILEKHRAAQEKLLERTKVQIVIPFADLIRLPTADPASRRLYDRILLLLDAATFLSQFRKGRRCEQDGDAIRVFADADDWGAILPLVEIIVAQKYRLIDKSGEDFLTRVKPLGLGAFSIEDLSAHTGMSPSTVRRRIKCLPPTVCTRKWDGKKLTHSFQYDADFGPAVELPSVEEVSRYLDNPEKLAS